MTKYATRYSRAFARIHALHGSPTLDIIPPVSSWSLPAGVTYNANYDQFLNGSNEAQAVNYASWATATTVDFIPTDRRNDVALTIGGVLSTGAVDGQGAIIEWSSTLQTKVSEAWGVVISNVLYRVRSWSVYPVGAAAPVRIQIELDKAE